MFFKESSGNTVFLLGKERKFQSHQSNVRCSKCWSDFGGKREDETQDLHIAVREFMEETALTIQLEKDKPLPNSFEQVLGLLKKRIVQIFTFPVNKKSYYKTFLVEIPYQALTYFKNFRHIISQLRKIPSHPAFHIQFTDTYLEKTNLAWVDIQQLSFACEHKGEIVLGEITEYLTSYFCERLKHVLQSWPNKKNYSWRKLPKTDTGFTNFNKKR